MSIFKEYMFYIQARNQYNVEKVNIRKVLDPIVEKVIMGLSQKQKSEWSPSGQRQQRQLNKLSCDKDFYKKIGEERQEQIYQIYRRKLKSPFFDLSGVTEADSLYFLILKLLLEMISRYKKFKLIGIAFERTKPDDAFLKYQQSLQTPHLIDLLFNECMIGDLIGSKLSKMNLSHIMKLSIHKDNISNKGIKQLMSLDMPQLFDLSIKQSTITTDSLQIFRKGLNKLKHFSVAYNKNFNTNETLKLLFCIVNSKRLHLPTFSQYYAEIHKMDFNGFLSKLELWQGPIKIRMIDGQRLKAQGIKKKFQSAYSVYFDYRY